MLTSSPFTCASLDSSPAHTDYHSKALAVSFKQVVSIATLTQG